MGTVLNVWLRSAYQRSGSKRVMKCLDCRSQPSGVLLCCGFLAVRIAWVAELLRCPLSIGFRDQYTSSWSGWVFILSIYYWLDHVLVSNMCNIVSASKKYCSSVALPDVKFLHIRCKFRLQNLLASCESLIQYLLWRLQTIPTECEKIAKFPHLERMVNYCTDNSHWDKFVFYISHIISNLCFSTNQ